MFCNTEIYSIYTFLKPNDAIYIADSSAVQFRIKLWPTEPVSKFSVFNEKDISDRIKLFFQKDYKIIDSARSICAYDYLTPIINSEDRKNYFNVLHNCAPHKKLIYEFVTKFKNNKGLLTLSNDTMVSTIPWNGNIEFAVSFITERIGNIWNNGITNEEWIIKQKEWKYR